MRLVKTKLLAVLTLILCMGVFYSTAYACQPTEETLTVNSVWVDGEMLRINVTDVDGNTSALAMRLADYVNDAENQEYISVQAADLMGNMSGIIRVRNPFFDPTIPPTVSTEPPVVEAAIPDGNMRQPLTPDGTGRVVDNVHDSDGIEFFTIGTDDGNIFYLIIDRQRSTDNVYLLNAVTEEDLISLAQAGGREVTPSGINNNDDAIPTPPHLGVTNDENKEPSATPYPDETENAPTSAPLAGNDNSMLIIIGVVVLAAGGIGYYFKIVKPKQNAVFDDEEDDNYGYDDSDGDNEDGDER